MQEKQYVEETLELDQDVYDKLVEYAKEKDKTIDEVVTEILESYLKKIQTVTIEEFAKILEEVDNDKPELLDDMFYTITDENGKELCRCVPIRYFENITN